MTAASVHSPPHQSLVGGLAAASPEAQPVIREPGDVARILQMEIALLDQEVLDHIAVGLGRFISLKDRGLGL